VHVGPGGTRQLTYCTNIHPADGWPGVEQNVRRFAPALKRRFSPDGPFGIGLRLSARDARELLEGDALTRFKTFLDEEGLYVAIINGFPFGAFHGTPVKADVYAPDWRDDARVDYTLALVEILSSLVPPDVDGGVSTAPLSYKAWMPAGDREGWLRVTENVVRVAGALVTARRDRGVLLHLDIEPEPDCSLETSDETIAFFEDWLMPVGAPLLAGLLGMSTAEARAALTDHIRVCFDCCHFAVEHEDPVEALGKLQRAGIRIGRIQLSSALRVTVPAAAEAAAAVFDRLRPFADATYLHQVVARYNERLEHFPDLSDALEAGHARDAEWRIHFHVPLFLDTYGRLDSTQDDVRRVIEAAFDDPVTTHLEIETYTWDVLPPELKLDLLESIGREYEWVMRRIDGAAVRKGVGKPER
jgi:sugar phosphate isomerase/epimerase